MSLGRQTLQLASNDPHSRYEVESLVIMSILDHYKRRPLKQDHVIGALLGARINDTSVSINNCFPVPHSERDDHVVAVDTDYYHQMLDLYSRSRVSASLSVVGWYTTSGSSALTPTTVAIANTFQAVMSGSPFEPVILSVDTTLESSKLSIKGFRMETIVSSSDLISPVVAAFNEVDLALITTNEDKIGIDALIQSQPDDDTFDSPATLLSPRRGLIMSLENLHGMLVDVCEYVDRVVAGQEVPDTEIGHMLAQTFGQMPVFEGSFFDRAFNDMISDLLSINYLTSLTRAQLAIADKVNLVA